MATRYRAGRTRYIVDRGIVYKAKSETISTADAITGDEAKRLLAQTPRGFGIEHDGISPRGPLKSEEAARFETGEPVAADRSDLAGHMDFFDRDNDGWISFVEGWAAWQDLGYSKDDAYAKQKGVVLAFFLLPKLKSPIKLIASFGRVIGVVRLLRRPIGDAVAAERFPAIAVDQIARPSGSTGVYGADGNIDETRYASFIKPFADAAQDGSLEQTAAQEILAQTKLGRVPTGQFATLFEVTRNMTNSSRVTIDQLRWVFDGSLAWRAQQSVDRA